QQAITNDLVMKDGHLRARAEAMVQAMFHMSGGESGRQIDGSYGTHGVQAGLTLEQGNEGTVYRGRYRIYSQAKTGVRNISSMKKGIYINHTAIEAEGAINLGETFLGRTEAIAKTVIALDAFGLRGL